MRFGKVMAVALSMLVIAGMARAAEASDEIKPQSALDLLDAPVSYTARFTVSSEKGTYEGDVWHMKGQERRQFTGAMGEQAVLLLRDKDAAYLLTPSRKWYVGFNLRTAASLAGGIDALKVERRKVGDETVAGIPSTRYKVSAKGGGGSFDGDAWFSAQGILVKAAGTLISSKGQKDKVETALSDLKLGPVDPDMLAVPKGWMGLDLRSIPAEGLQQTIKGLMAVQGAK